MGNKFKRFLSLALVLVMVFSFVPASVFATDGQDPAAYEDGGNDTDIPDEGNDDDTVVPDEGNGDDTVVPDEGDDVLDPEPEKTPDEEPAPCTLLEGCILGEGHEGECFMEAPCQKDEKCILMDGHDGECVPDVAQYETYVAYIGEQGYETLQKAIDAAQDGNTIVLATDIQSDSVLKIEKAITLDLGGFKLTTTNGWGGLQLKNGCSVKNGTLLHTGRVNAIKVWDVVSIEDLVIEVTDTTADKTVGGISIQENAAGIDTIKYVTMKGVGLDYGIETYNCGNAQVIGTMDNVKIDAVGTGMLLSAPCGTATNCTIKGGVSGIDMLLKGTYSVSIDLVNCVVEGGEQAVYAHDEQKGYTYVGSISLTADENTEFVNENGVYLKEEIASTTNAAIENIRDYKVTYITNVEELVAFAEAVNAGTTFEGETVKLTADIDLSSVASWTPIGNTSNYFCGTFDGQNHTISNMTINVNTPNADQFAGLFGGVKKATIKNLKMTNVSIDAVGAKVRAAAVVGIAYCNEVRTDATINFENISVVGCTINAEAKSGSAIVGGVVGYSYPANMSGITVSGLTINAKAEGNEVRAAAINGYVCGQNVSNNGNTRAPFTVKNFDVDNVSITVNAYTAFAGGYAPYTYYGYITLENGTIDGLKIKVKAHEAFVGGLVGYFWRSDNGHNVKNVAINGIDFDVTTDYLGETRVGGMVGTSQSPNTKYTDCSVSGKIVESCSDPANLVNYHAKVGGFVARTYEYAQQIYTNCVADVDVSGSNVAGGFVGNHTSHVNYYNCHAKGDVTANIAGGFAGRLTEHGYTQDVTFDGCSASGTVTGTNVAGGFIGSTVNHGWAAWAAGNGTPYGKNITLKNCTASENVTSGTDYEAGVIGEAKVADGKTITLEDVSYTVEPAYYPNTANVKEYVAKVGESPYESLREAVAAANATEGGATVTLLKDVTLGEKLTISGNVTISGEKTITRADTYTGTLFTVSAGATLTLDGGLVIDGANEWTYIEENGEKKFIYEAKNYVEGTGYNSLDTFVTAEADAPVATADAISVSGALVLNKVTLQNHWGKDGASVVDLAANGQLTMNADAVITHNVTNGQGPAVYMNEDSVFTMNGGQIGWNAGRHHGGGAVSNHGGYMTMYGGKIDNNFNVDGMGVALFIYDTRAHSAIQQPNFAMEGGEICYNVSFPGTSANKNGTAIYARNGIMQMNGGSIHNNYGRNFAGVGVGSVALTITGGSIVNNQNVLGNTAETEHDLIGIESTTITGGTFTQDVSAYLAPNTGLVYDEATGTYGATKDLYEYNRKNYKTFDEVLEAIKANSKPGFGGNADTPVVKVLASHKIDKYITINTSLNLDLNGQTITRVGGTALYVNGDGITVTIKGEGTVESTTAEALYVNAGTVKIENGSFKSGVDKGPAVYVINNGQVEIYGGTFSNANGEFVLNEYDSTRDATSITVYDGTFYNFNPANNASEGAGTNFVADGYIAETKDEGATYTVRALHYVAQVGETKYESLQEAVNAAQAEEIVTLINDVELATYLTIGKSITLDLGAYKVTRAGGTALYVNGADITVTITGEGSVESTTAEALYVNAGTVKIENGNFKSGVDKGPAVYVINNGQVEIYGGTFSNANGEFVLNEYDKTRDATSITVYGGTFYNFNPANNASEGAGTNFVAYGYEVDEANDTYTVKVVLPEVEIIDIKDTLMGDDPDLTFALNFSIKDIDKLTEEYLNDLMAAYGDYYTDYVLTISGLSDADVTFNAIEESDGYLAGQYDAFGPDWLPVPFEDVTVKNGESLYIMEYAAKLMGQSGLRFTLAEVAAIVQNFDCGVYFTPEFLAANPDIEVTLELKVFTEDDEGNIVEDISVATNEFDVADIAAAVSGEGKQTEYYATFTAAMADAEAGDTVSLLKDAKLTGKYTITKAVTIDGNGHSIIADETAVWYTVSGKLNIKNYKTHLIGVNSSNVTLKNVVLDCNNNAAGINVYCAQNVVFDNVSIINATKGMAALTVNGSTLTFKTKFEAKGNSIALDISNGSGVTSDLGVTVAEDTVFDLDNKTVKFASVAVNDVTGAVDANGLPYFAAMDNAYFYTEAQINARTTAYSNGLKLLADVTLNKDLTISGTLDLNGHNLTMSEDKLIKTSGKLTIVGEGNIEGELVLTKVGATITAPADMDVTTTVDGYFVVYENGVYSLEVAIAKRVGSDGADIQIYSEITDAMNAANEGETVVLLKDFEDSMTWVFAGVTLDLNGYKLDTKYMACFGNIVDNSESNAGLLVVPDGRFAIPEANAQLPVKTADGYKFFEVDSIQDAKLSDTKYAFITRFEPVAHEYLLKGREASGVSIVVRVSWNAADGVRTQDFVYSDELVSGFINSYGASGYDSMFTLVMKNAENFNGLTFKAHIVSNTGVEFAAPYNGGNN